MHCNFAANLTLEKIISYSIYLGLLETQYWMHTIHGHYYLNISFGWSDQANGPPSKFFCLRFQLKTFEITGDLRATCLSVDNSVAFHKLFNSSKPPLSYLQIMCNKPSLATILQTLYYVAEAKLCVQKNVSFSVWKHSSLPSPFIAKWGC